MSAISVYLLLISWTSLSSHAQSQSITTTKYALLQSDQKTSIDVILLIDSSGSMSTTDPKNLRIRATRFLLDYLGANTVAQKNVQYRVGLANFGGKLGPSFDLQAPQSKLLRDRLQAERIEGTEFVAPLTYAAEQFKYSDPHAQKIVILLTDGQPGPEGNVLEGEVLQSYFDRELMQAIQSLQSIHAELFVLAIGDAQQDSERWHKLINDKYIKVENTSDLEKIYHRLFSATLSFSSQQIWNQKSGLKFPVDSLTQHITLSLIKSTPALTITLSAPDKTIILPENQLEDESYYQFYSIQDPQEGQWEIKIQGDGSIEYWIDRRYPEVSVKFETAPQYSSQPLTVTARLVDSRQITKQSQHIELDIIRPDKHISSVMLAANTTGGYTGVFTDTKLSGSYSFKDKVRVLPDGPLLRIWPRPDSITLSPIASVAPPAVSITPFVISPIASPTNEKDNTEESIKPSLNTILIIIIIGLIVGMSGLIYKMLQLRKKLQEQDETLQQQNKIQDLVEHEPDQAIIEVGEILYTSRGLQNKSSSNAFKEFLLDCFEKSIENLISQSKPLKLDKKSAQVVRDCVHLTSKSNDNENYINDKIVKFLQASSVGDSDSKETTKRNLQLIRGSFSNTSTITNHALRTFQEMVDHLDKLVNYDKDNLRELAGHLHGFALWFNKHNLEDSARYYHYLQSLIRYPLHLVKCPELSENFWLSLQANPHENQYLGSHFVHFRRALFSLNKDISKFREPEQSILKLIAKHWQEKLENDERALEPELTFLQFNDNLQKVLEAWSASTPSQDERNNASAFRDWLRRDWLSYNSTFDEWWQKLPIEMRIATDKIFKNGIPNKITETDNWILENPILEKVCEGYCKNHFSCRVKGSDSIEYKFCSELENLSYHGILFRDMSNNKWHIPMIFEYWWKYWSARCAVGRIMVNGGTQGIGTGVYIGKKHLLTTYHVVCDIKDKFANSATVTFQNRINSLEMQPYWLEIPNELLDYSDNREYDYAVLKIVDNENPLDISAVQICNKAPGAKEQATIVHYPEGGSLEINQGSFLAKQERILTSGERFKHNLPTKPGSSGAPIFNNDWEVVALHTAKDDSDNRLATAIKNFNERFMILREIKEAQP